MTNDGITAQSPSPPDQKRKRKWPWVVAAVLLLFFVIGTLNNDDEGAGTPSDDPAVTLPEGLTGMNSASARDQLQDMGFAVTIESVDGRMVIVESNWNVVSASLHDEKNVVLRVAKPAETTVTPPELADVPTTTEPLPDEPDPTLVEEPAPAEDPAPAPEAYYSDCAEARAAGAAPLHVDEPGYRPGLDRDDDGVACEAK
jgi:hypothetical protein